MSIAVAAGVGLVGGGIASGLIFNYTKNEYEQRISTLEGLVAALEEHLAQMIALREQIPQFWEDDNARTISLELVDMVGETQREMETAKGYLRTLRTIVSELDGSKGLIAGTVEDLGALVSSGIKG